MTFVSTASMDDEAIKALQVSQSRLMYQLHETCQWGSGERWGNGLTDIGMKRLALSDADKQVRDWFVEETTALGCTVTVDQMGNIFAVHPGTNPDLPPIYTGSHLDTQPTGGRYDGILGVMAGLELLRVLRDNNIQTTHPIGIANWTNEEGARFPITMMSSGVWAEAISLERAHQTQEVGTGVATVKSELERINYLGTVPATYKSTPMAAHFELHIEQGPILENNQQKVGIVTGVQAYKWFTVDVNGRAAHTGTTPLDSRGDALLAAARMIMHSNIVAADFGALCSTGILTLEPASTNVIPDHVRFTLDIRATADAVVESVEKRLKNDFAILAAGDHLPGYPPTPHKSLPLHVMWSTDADSPAVQFHTDCIKAVEYSAQAVLGSASLYRQMTSGAGHDSVYTSRHCPTSMIFVPSRNGVSHNPEEWTSAEDCALGAQILLQAVVRFDRDSSS